MFVRSQPKIGCSITKRKTSLSSFDVRKDRCSMNNVVNLVKALLGSMFDVCSFKAKNRVLEFDEHIRVRSMFEK